MGDKYLSFHSGRDTHVVINQVAKEFPEVAAALNSLDTKVLRDFSNTLSSKMNWSMAEMFSQAVSGLSMDVLEGFASTAELVDSRRLEDFSRAVDYLERDPVVSNLAHVLEDMKKLVEAKRETLSLIAEANLGLVEAKNSLVKLDVVALAESYHLQEAQKKGQYAAKLKKLEQELQGWKTRCMYAVGIAVIAVFLLLR
ncbi:MULTISPECIES: hypothetical protein [unclassified Streptomyces]|uniref:hypothetical protein n=1 Tax=unclassified Streptomyces TaxID=2593676 RepID=UPI000BAC9B29|nr:MULTISPECIES: hypothetical protein [unclassified Streptomyces]ASY34038.1 hypothetical protein CAC01_16365 [Streptomyces sp. CLI2509]MYX20202.1 hypothetical protein [Streptomyces sp. SID8380]